MWKRNNKVWKPKGGEMVFDSDLMVDTVDLTGPASSAPETPRPDSGNVEAQKALAAISLDFIMGRPISPEKMQRLGAALPEVAVAPFVHSEEAQ